MSTENDETGEVKTVLHLRPDTSLETAVHYAVGAASVCWSETPSGEFESDTAKRIADELLAHIKAGGVVDEPLVKTGDEVSVFLRGSREDIEIYGELLAVFSGAGETDGMIQIQVYGEPTPRNVYERHILWLQRDPS